MNFAETSVDDLLKVLHFDFHLFFSGSTATPLFIVKIFHLFAVVAFIGTIGCQSTMHYVFFLPLKIIDPSLAGSRAAEKFINDAHCRNSSTLLQEFFSSAIRRSECPSDFPITRIPIHLSCHPAKFIELCFIFLRRRIILSDTRRSLTHVKTIGRGTKCRL